MARRIPGAAAQQSTAADYARAVHFYPMQADEAVAQGFSKGGLCYDCQTMGRGGGAASAGRIFGSIFTPELSPSFLLIALDATWKTLTFAVAGVTLAVGFGLLLGVAASGVLYREGRLRTFSIVAARFILAFLRSIHELV